ncbi:MAG: hypothetical protein JXR88_08965, partial [Clostridia bacterium]|nr:hypothetical protein [Clostridia bacterium]
VGFCEGQLDYFPHYENREGECRALSTRRKVMSEYLSNETMEIPNQIFKNKIKWLIVTIALLLILVVFFLYQMVKGELFIKMNQQAILENTYYKIMMSQEDLMDGLEHESNLYHDLMSAKEHLEDAKAFMRLTGSYYNRQLKHEKIIGNPAVTEFINYYVYRINDWLYVYEKENIHPNDEALQAMIDDLERMRELFQLYDGGDASKNIMALAYDDLKDALCLILENSNTDFTYESIYYEK